MRIYVDGDTVLRLSIYAVASSALDVKRAEDVALHEIIHDRLREKIIECTNIELKVGEAENLCRVLEDEVGRYTLQSNSLRRDLSALRESVKKREENAESTSDEMTSLMERERVLVSNLRKISFELADRRDRLKRTQSELNRSRESLRALKSELRDTEYRHEDMSRKKRKGEVMKCELKERIATSASEQSEVDGASLLETLNARMAAVDAEIGALAAERDAIDLDVSEKAHALRSREDEAAEDESNARSQLRETRSRLSTLEEDFEATSRKVQSLQASVESKTATKTSLDANLAESIERVRVVERALEETRHEEASISDKVTELEASNQSAESNIQGCKDRIDSTRHALRERRTEETRLEAEMRALEARRDAASTKIGELEAESRAIRSNVLSAEERLSSFENDEENTSERCGDVDSACASMDSELVNTKKRIADMRKSIDSLRARRTLAEEEQVKLTGELQKRRSERESREDELLEKLASMQSKLRERDSSIRALKDAIAAAQSQFDTLTETARLRSNDASDARRALQQQLREADAKVSGLNAQLWSEDRRLAQMKDDISASESRVRILTTQLDARRQELGALDECFPESEARLNRELLSMIAKRDEMSESLRGASSDLVSMRAKLSDIRESRDFLTKRWDDLFRQKLPRLRSSVESLKESHRSKVARADELAKETSRLQTEVDTVTTELDSLFLRANEARARAQYGERVLRDAQRASEMRGSDVAKLQEDRSVLVSLRLDQDAKFSQAMRELETEYAEVREKYAKASEERSAMEARASRAKRTLAELRAERRAREILNADEVATFEKNRAELQEERAAVNSVASQKDVEVKSLGLRLRRLRDETRRLEKETKEAETTTKRLETEIALGKEETNRIRARIDDKKRSCESIRERLEALSDMETILRSEKTSKTSELHEAKRELGEVKRSLRSIEKEEKARSDRMRRAIAEIERAKDRFPSAREALEEILVAVRLRWTEDA
eukprot:g2820.t1